MNKKLFDFIAKSPSPFHAVKNICETLSEKGYSELCESEKWNLEAGKGYYVGSIGEYSGEIPYTCFMAYPNYIKNNKEQVEGFLRAIKKAYLFITTSSSEEVADALLASFDGSTKQELALAVERYLEIDAWSNTPAMSKDSFTRLLSVLKNAGTLDEDVDFSKVVDNTIANTI